MGAFKSILLFRRHGGQVTGEFPGKTGVSSAVRDASEDIMFRPLLALLTNLSRMIDENRIRYTQVYLLYIFLFLILLLAWKMQ
jgi:hypothetical protein